LIVLRDFENHENGRHGRANDACEQRPHSNQRVRASLGGRKRRDLSNHEADCATGHRSNVQARCEDAACIAGCVRHYGGGELQDTERCHGFEYKSAIERLIDVVITDAHDRGGYDQHQSDHDPAQGGLRHFGPRWRLEEQGAQPQKTFAESQRHQSTDDAEPRIRDEFSGMNEVVRRDVKERFVAENGSLDDDRGD
jgi:hypothetical protein